MLSIRHTLQYERQNRLKLGMENYFMPMEMIRKLGQQPSYDKIHFKRKIIKKNKEGHCINNKVIKKKLHLLTYTRPMQKHLYIKQILTDIKGEMARIMIIIGDFSTPLIPTNR